MIGFGYTEERARGISDSCASLHERLYDSNILGACITDQTARPKQQRRTPGNRGWFLVSRSMFATDCVVFYQEPLQQWLLHWLTISGVFESYYGTKVLLGYSSLTCLAKNGMRPKALGRKV